jgi:DNA-binding transcriptional LysR family regulator
VLAGEVDAAIIELPVHEPALTVGFRFPAQDQFILLGREHPLAVQDDICVEDLADLDLLHRSGDAPDYWKAARTPPVTPSGVPILSTAGINTVQQGISLAASGLHAMLACRPMIEHYQRSDLRQLRVRGLEATSQLGLVWRTDHTTPALCALVELLEHASVTMSEE